MPKGIDLTGKKIGRWTVLARSENRGDQRMWFCECDCGTKRNVMAGNLLNRKTKSCGCLKDEKTRERVTTHGLTGTPEWTAWLTMHRRCREPKFISYPNYGGRGISVCDRWKKFEHFLDDMGKKPSAEHTLDRIDNKKGYGPKNCRWATRMEQARNTRKNVMITINGHTRCLADWADRLGIKRDTAYMRLHRGWTPKQSVLGRNFELTHKLAERLIA